MYKGKKKGIKNRRGKLDKKDFEFLMEMLRVDTSIPSNPSDEDFEKRRDNSRKIFQLIKEYIKTNTTMENMKNLKMEIIEREGIENLLLTYERDYNNGYLLLDAHYDVVPAGDWKEAFSPREEGDYIIGRGSGDNKGLILPALKALLDVVEKEEKLNLILAISGDEEIGFRGAKAIKEYLKEKNYGLRYAIVLEPGDGDIPIKIGFRGVIRFLLSMKGESMHAASIKDNVEKIESNPLNEFPYYLELSNLSFRKGLEGDKEGMEKTTIAITDVRTNNSSYNTTPSILELVMDVRYNIGQSIDKIKEILLNTGKGKVEKSIKEIVNFHPVFSNDPEMIKIASLAYEKTFNKKPRISTSGGASNLYHYGEIANGFEIGVEKINIHGREEKVRKSELEKIYEFLLNFFEGLKS